MLDKRLMMVVDLDLIACARGDRQPLESQGPMPAQELPGVRGVHGQSAGDRDAPAAGSAVAAWEVPRGWPSPGIYIGVAKRVWEPIGVKAVLGVAIGPLSGMLAIAWANPSA